MKKPYVEPKMNVIDIEISTQLLASSSEGDCTNPWWCDNQPDPDDWWKK